MTIETTDERFETDVLIRSQLELVVVDFWADWCAPCRMLAPILERLDAEHEGFTLVKAETDKNQQAAQQYSVSGIPAVFAFLDGKIVDSFQGVLPEPQLEEWLNNNLEKARLYRLESSLEADAESALAEIREVVAVSESDSARVLLVQALHRVGESDECRAVLSELSKRGFLEPECERIQAELDLGAKADVDIDALRSAAAADGADLAKQFELAEGLVATNAFDEGFEICLRLVQEDRAGQGERARLLMLEAFKMLGDDSEVTRDYRRKLSMVLY
ncbi:MAG: tetratricopeptide repeat protein [Planctomycetota bacterium]